MKHFAPLHGLTAATHTPFHPDGSLNLSAVEGQATHLSQNGVGAAFIAGTTGESASLTLEERLALTRRWTEVTRGSRLRVVVHVGANCLADARTLAAQAASLGAAAVSALAPSYFKPASIAALVDSMAEIAAAAPELPFYYYEIPILTGVTHSPAEFLAQAAERIPNLAGLKFTSANLMEYQLCRAFRGGYFDLPYGFDEALLGALALGAAGAVGSGFNFAAPIYRRLLERFAAGDLEAARREQLRGVLVVQILARHGYLASAKAVMKMLGIDVGPTRLPVAGLTGEQSDVLRTELEQAGFFGWLNG